MNPVTGLSLGRIVIGAASLARPELVAGTLGTTSSSPVLTQWFGNREIALGAATLLSRGSARRTMLLIGAAVDAADAATAYQATQGGSIPKSAGLPAVAVAAGATLVGLLGLRFRKAA